MNILRVVFYNTYRTIDNDLGDNYYTQKHGKTSAWILLAFILDVILLPASLIGIIIAGIIK